MKKIELAPKNAESLRAVKNKLGIGKHQVYALRDKEGNVTTNMNKILKVAGDVYRDL